MTPKEGSGLWALLKVVPDDGKWHDLQRAIALAERHVAPAAAARHMDVEERHALLRGRNLADITLEERQRRGRQYAVRTASRLAYWFERDNPRHPTKIRRRRR